MNYQEIRQSEFNKRVRFEISQGKTVQQAIKIASDNLSKKSLTIDSMFDNIKSEEA
jgi:hypothetical protein